MEVGGWGSEWGSGLGGVWGGGWAAVGAAGGAADGAAGGAHFLLQRFIVILDQRSVEGTEDGRACLHQRELHLGGRQLWVGGGGWGVSVGLGYGGRGPGGGGWEVSVGLCYGLSNEPRMEGPASISVGFFLWGRGSGSEVVATDARIRSLAESVLCSARSS